MDNFIPNTNQQPDGFKDLSLNSFSNNGKVIPNITPAVPDFDVNITFVNAKVSNGKYSFLFMNSIMSKSLTSNSMGIRASQIDMKKLQASIMSKVDKKDLKYIKLKEFSTSRSIFIFDIDSWLDDALKNVSGKVYLSRYDKEFRLNIQPPTMVRHYGIRVEFSKYVANYFKEYAKKKPQQRNSLFNIIPKSYEKTLKTHISNMFDYEYDFQSNRIIVRLKTIFLTGLIFSSFALAGNNFKANMSFEDMVKKNLTTFPEGKLNKLAPKRFY